MVVVTWRGNASCHGRTNYFCWTLQVLRRKTTIHVWCIVDLVLYFSEGIKVSALKCNHCPTSLRASFWLYLCNLGPVVIVVVESGGRVLCPILGDRDWDRLCYNIRLRTLAGEVGRVYHGCHDSMCTKRNKCFAFDLFKVLTPYLDVILN